MWARLETAIIDPDPTEPITPLEKSAEISILNDPPCDECENYDCPGMFGCPSVTLESLAAVVPGLGPGEQPIVRNFSCGRFWFDLEPRILAPHVVASRRFTCRCSKERLLCHLESYRNVFEQTPRDGIRVSDTVSVEEALEVASLFRARKVEGVTQDFYWPEAATLHGVYRNGKNFELDLADCGENMLVRLEHSWRGNRLRFLKGVHGAGCI